MEPPQVIQPSPPQPAAPSPIAPQQPVVPAPLTPQPVPPIPPPPAPSNRSRMFRFGVLALIFAVLLVVGFLIAQNHKSGNAGSPIVTINDDGFSPRSIRVKPGVQVTWHNNGSATHQISIDSYSGKSKNPVLSQGLQVAAGNDYSLQLDETGTYKYSDPFHPELKGEVIVK